jgi:hypothetical protein
MGTRKVPLNVASDVAAMAFRSLRDICDVCRKSLVGAMDSFTEMFLADSVSQMQVRVVERKLFDFRVQQI